VIEVRVIEQDDGFVAIVPAAPCLVASGRTSNAAVAALLDRFPPGLRSRLHVSESSAQ